MRIRYGSPDIRCQSPTWTPAACTWMSTFVEPNLGRGGHQQHGRHEECE
jgi:hypothetical protein